MDNEWKNRLRERFSDYSAPEPEGLWERVEQGIAGKPRRSMLPVWLLTGAAAAAAVALAVLLPSRKTPGQPVPESTDRYVQAVPVDTVDGYPVVSGQDDVPIAGQDDISVFTVAAASRRTLLAEAGVSKDVSKEMDDAVAFEDPHPSSLPMKEEVEESVSATTNNKEEMTVEEALRSTVPSLEIKRGPTRRRFSVAAYGNGGQGASAQSAGYGMSNSAAYHSTRGIYNDGGNYNSGNGSSSNEGGSLSGLPGGMVYMLSGNRASTYDARHWAPVRTGVSVAWEFVPHLSLVTGLNWTSLQSSFTESVAGMRTESRQSLGYLGVPLRLEAGFEPVERLRLYIGAGGMVEKGLLATSKIESYIGDHLEDAGKGHPDTGGLLWSVGASAGAEYRFGDRVGVYVAPGIERHFDNGAQARSAYTEKPLHWNVDLGVRFHFGI